MLKSLIPCAITCTIASAALADPPVVEGAEIEGARISVTLSHPDTGWDHYANAWSVFTPDGQLLGTRTLLHPHVNEQPFTRSLRLDAVTDKALGFVTITATDSNGDESTPFTLRLD